MMLETVDLHVMITFFCILPSCGKHSLTLSNPCPSDLLKTTVADMCFETTATEETNNGSEVVDSVVMRVLTQEDNCVCQVTFQNESIQIFSKKYGGLTGSAPKSSQCGLHIYIELLNQSTKPQTEPIKCTTGLSERSFGLLEGGILQFTSKVTTGEFTYGYCIQISRSNVTRNAALRLSCRKSSTGTLSSHNTSTTPFVETSYSSHRGLSHGSNSTPPLETNDIFHQEITAHVSTLYIVVGVCVGAVIVIISAVLGILYKRRKSSIKRNSTSIEQNGQSSNNDTCTADAEYDGIKYNVLYVPSHSQPKSKEINYSTVDFDNRENSKKALSVDSHYSSVELDCGETVDGVRSGGQYSTEDIVCQNAIKNRKVDGPLDKSIQDKVKSKPTIKPKPQLPGSGNNNVALQMSNKEIKHVSPPNGSENLYAVVDKGTSQPIDQTYAVVDKTRKQK